MESFDATTLTQQLERRGILLPVIFFETTDSTNTRAFASLAHCSGPVVVVAQCQTEGRGTRGRKWFSGSRGNLYLSIGFRRSLRPEILAEKGVALNGVISRYLSRQYGKKFQSKWPNDILFEGKKLAGLLLESKILNGKAVRWVVGLGLNVNGTTHLWPKDIRAVTLQQAVGVLIDMAPLAADLIQLILESMDQD
jgi:BirA family biotin operon repressor/biotin-[acetyl-CoA-carboxylase] ligase